MTTPPATIATPSKYIYTMMANGGGRSKPQMDVSFVYQPKVSAPKN